MNKKTVLLCFVLLLASVFLTQDSLQAQCAMCTTIVASNKAAGGTIGDGLNTGILYLMAVPYVLLISIGYILFKKNKSTQTS